jgi:hypothetical protein
MNAPETFCALVCVGNTQKVSDLPRLQLSLHAHEEEEEEWAQWLKGSPNEIGLEGSE